MKNIVSISFGQVDINFNEVVEFNGEKIRISHYSTNFDAQYTEELVKKFDSDCDVIALSGLPPSMKTKGMMFEHPQVQKIKSMTKETLIVDGQLLKDAFIPYALRKYIIKNPNFLKGKSVSFYSGVLEKQMAEVFSIFDVSLKFADPYTFLHLPKLLTNAQELLGFSTKLSYIARFMNLGKSNISSFSSPIGKKALGNFYKSDIFCSNSAFLNIIDLEHLQGKTVVLDVLNDGVKEKLKEAKVNKVVQILPKVIDIPFINFSIVEALFQVTKKEPDPLTTEDIFNIVQELSLDVIEHDLQEADSLTHGKFAFIIHPLSADYILKHPMLRPVKSLLQPAKGVLEDAIAHSNGFFYGKIEGIVSEATGKEVEGLIYTVTETPKKLMQADPVKIYKKLVGLSYQAKKEGADIIGLGAYTKIVGDAGVTVERMSPIPVTTGNSLSSCSTLWAAKYALDKMGFVKKRKGIYFGKAMVVGATGSIGAVSAKLLAQSFQEIFIVAPRGYKLLELKDEILEINPKCKITLSTKPDKYSHEMDLIITTTSAQGKKILDIEKVKSGCVICDVSRPFDISEEDAIKRPDVMVIASGEVQLPGKIKMKVDLGLEGNIVYACLAETALLAMEGRHESFTLSRNISYKKVLEIDAMAKKHGVRLANIVGHNGFITDREFELCRQHALKKIEGDK